MSFLDDFNKQIKDPTQAALYMMGAKEFQKTGKPANIPWTLFLCRMMEDKEKKENGK